MGVKTSARAKTKVTLKVPGKTKFSDKDILLLRTAQFGSTKTTTFLALAIERGSGVAHF
jgi:hypothetical protein